MLWPGSVTVQYGQPSCVNAGSQFQLLALGVVLIVAALLNGLTTSRLPRGKSGGR